MSAEQIERFYAAFDRRDGTAMAAMYAPDGHFRDPVFGDLTGAEAGAMWRMLTRTARDLKVELAEHDDASARWIATYTFAATGRPVVNDVRATFRFADGLIVDHVDEFSFWKWSRQALGPVVELQHPQPALGVGDHVDLADRGGQDVERQDLTPHA